MLCPGGRGVLRKLFSRSSHIFRLPPNLTKPRYSKVLSEKVCWNFKLKRGASSQTGKTESVKPVIAVCYLSFLPFSFCFLLFPAQRVLYSFVMLFSYLVYVCCMSLCSMPANFSAFCIGFQSYLYSVLGHLKRNKENMTYLLSLLLFKLWLTIKNILLLICQVTQKSTDLIYVPYHESV